MTSIHLMQDFFCLYHNIIIFETFFSYFNILDLPDYFFTYQTIFCIPGDATVPQIQAVMTPVMKNEAETGKESLADRHIKEIGVTIHQIPVQNPEMLSLNPLEAVNQEVDTPGEGTDQILTTRTVAGEKVGKKKIGVKRVKRIIDEDIAALATEVQALIGEGN